jgi:GDPmannose 4,6-dehydratase
MGLRLADQRALLQLSSWEGEGVDEVGIDVKSGKVRVRIDPAYFRPTEVETLLGDPKKCREVLKWQHKVPFDELVREMVESDIKLAAKGDHYN